MRNDSKSCAVFIFLGLMLCVFSVVGFICSNDPGAFQRPDRYDLALNQFLAFCAGWKIPCGIVGAPMFLIALIVSLVKGKKNG